MSSHFHLAAVVTPAGTINQISSQAVSPEVTQMLEIVDGQVDRTFSAVLKQSPVINFTTSAIARALGYVGLSGLAMSGTGCDFYFQKADPGGTRDTSACVRVSCTDGIIVPTGLDAAENAAATLDYAAHCISPDGTTAPMTFTSGVSLPALVTSREFFTLGPAYFNGTQYTGLKSWRLTPGLRVITDNFDGQAYDELAYILSREAQFRLRGTDMGVLATFASFAAQGATDSVIYLRKVAEGGTRVANATAQHISFTVDAGMIAAESAASSNLTPGMAEYSLTPTYDGTNALIVPNLATAIA